jgi:hypothetical protein
MADRRIATLARHLSISEPAPSGDLSQNSTSAAMPSVDPAQVYRFLTRDNVQLRQQIFDFLRVSLSARYHCAWKPHGLRMETLPVLKDGPALYCDALSSSSCHAGPSLPARLLLGPGGFSGPDQQAHEEVCGTSILCGGPEGPRICRCLCSWVI